MGSTGGLFTVTPKNAEISIDKSGEGGIRTPDTVTRMPHFECGAFNHSATSPSHCNRLAFRASTIAQKT